MDSCIDCVHFGICEKGFPFADGKGGGWCEDFMSKANNVEVVRCKDCKHLEIDPGLRYDKRICLMRGGEYGYCKDNDFCSYGERREGE